MLPAIVVVVALAVILARQWIAGPALIASAVREGIPGFTCDAMLVRHVRGSRAWRHHQMSAALILSPACETDLRQRIRRDPRFHFTGCSGGEQCWTRRDAGATYRFNLRQTHVAFDFERR